MDESMLDYVTDNPVEGWSVCNDSMIGNDEGFIVEQDCVFPHRFILHLQDPDDTYRLHVRPFMVVEFVDRDTEFMTLCMIDMARCWNPEK